MSDIMKMASLDSPAAVWIIFLFILVFMGFLFYVALMDKNHADDMAAKPLDDSDLLLDHEIDGIRELDNDLPPWWIKLFYVSIIFAIVYMLGYHVVDLWNLPDAEYVAELQKVETEDQVKKANMNSAGSSGSGAASGVVEVDLKAQALASGKKLFIQTCAACHMADGGGGLGPNLTDKYWVHGGDKASIVKVISEGVPGTAMVAWLAILQTEEKVEVVADYILSLQGTTPANPLPPKGELYTP